MPKHYSFNLHVIKYVQIWNLSTGRVKSNALMVLIHFNLINLIKC